MTRKKQPEKNIKPVERKSAKISVGDKASSKWLWIGSVLVLTFIAFFPSLHCGFTAWDDQVYVTENELIKSLSFENIKALFLPANAVSLNYHPLTMLSLAIDYHFSKLDPFRYHFINILFHLVNTFLVFLFVYRLTGKKILAATFVSLFFGIHPMHVESVTWVAERKDVLYAFFFLLGLYSYLSFLEKKKLSLLIVTFLFFVLSVLSKAMAVVFPLVLFLIDYFNGRKLTFRTISEKIPFFLVSLVFGILAINIQSKDAIASFETFSIFERISFTFYGFFSYIWKLFIPLNLSAFYPYPNANIEGKYPASFYIIAISGLVLFFLIGIFSLIRKGKMKTISFGAGFYFVTIMMVLQFISVGGVIMADRYSYVSYIGLLIPLGIGLSNSIEKNKARKNTIVLTIFGIALVFSCITFQRTKVWTNAETLWTDVIEKYPYPYWHVELAYEGRGKFYATKKNDPEKALIDYNTLESMKTKNPANYNNLGNLYGTKAQEFEKSGDSLQANQLYVKSVDYFTKALSFDSTVISTFTNRGLVYIYMKKYDLAAADYDRALQMDSNSFELREKRAYILYLLNRREEAIRDYDKLILLDPGKTQLYFLRGIAKFNSDQQKAAIEDFKIVIEQEPQNASALYNLSFSENQVGDYANALLHAEKALRLGFKINPEYIETLRSKIKN